MKTLEEFISGIPETVESMKNTMQNPQYHGEGDVWTHTMMVLDELHKTDDYKSLSDGNRRILDYACLLHDVGKTLCTISENNQIESPGHSHKSEVLARRLLWDAGFCGEHMQFRESVCALVRNHGKPPHPMDERQIQQLSMLTPARKFNLKMLYMLSKADWDGRICADKEEGTIFIELFKDYAKDLKCFESAIVPPDDYSRHAFLCGATYSPMYKVFNGTWGTVTVMSGLPGSGKTTWIQRYKPTLPVVSLDEIRRSNSIKPTDNQGEVVNIAVEKAKELLRSHQPFVWDATCLNHDMRKKIVGLAFDYCACADIVYVETDEETRRKRNAEREHAVPEEVVDKMRMKVEPPLNNEAHGASWMVS